ncbi:MAG: hypothetical protein ACI9FJ_002856 [Alteromonadaceae bacterium]
MRLKVEILRLKSGKHDISDGFVEKVRVLMRLDQSDRLPRHEGRFSFAVTVVLLSDKASFYSDLTERETIGSQVQVKVFSWIRAAVIAALFWGGVGYLPLHYS